MSTERIAVLVALLLAVTAHPLPAQNPAQLDKGRQLFLGMCSRCHGAEGGGAEGPSLNRPVLTRAVDDQALRTIIQDGIPDRGMPRIRRMSNGELDALAAYVRSLGRTAEVARQGSAEKGKAVYQRLGCASCHLIAGEGVTFGPELTNIGARRSPGYLRQAVVDPSAALPRGGTDVPGRGFDEFLPVRIVTREGREVNGLRVNEDSFSIQVRDAGNHLYSFQKAGLQTLDKEFGKSLMPDYKTRIAGADLDDLVAYLSSLGGAK
ncbi:MAG TPA: c-type cytochrome [Bryobacteraceae bacterium]|nr:c-type cytochrome [Bryobacteraceae bacterium]